MSERALRPLMERTAMNCVNVPITGLAMPLLEPARVHLDLLDHYAKNLVLQMRCVHVDVCVKMEENASYKAANVRQDGLDKFVLISVQRVAGVRCAKRPVNVPMELAAIMSLASASARPALQEKRVYRTVRRVHTASNALTSVAASTVANVRRATARARANPGGKETIVS